MLSRFFLERPVFAWVIAIAIMAAGVFAIVQLPVSQYPPIAPPSTSAALAAWRALALVLAVVLAALGFAAYTQPELLLNYTGLRYCG